MAGSNWAVLGGSTLTEANTGVFIINETIGARANANGAVTIVPASVGVEGGIDLKATVTSAHNFTTLSIDGQELGSTGAGNITVGGTAITGGGGGGGLSTVATDATITGDGTIWFSTQQLLRPFSTAQADATDSMTQHMLR